MFFKGHITCALLLLFLSVKLTAQENDPFIAIEVPSHNMIKYNQFFLNPTFSAVNQQDTISVSITETNGMSLQIILEHT